MARLTGETGAHLIKAGECDTFHPDPAQNRMAAAPEMAASRP